MTQRTTYHRLMLLVALTCLALTVSAHGGHGHGGGGGTATGPPSDDDPGSGSESSSGTSTNSGGGDDDDYTGTRGGGSFWPGGPAYGGSSGGSGGGGSGPSNNGFNSGGGGSSTSSRNGAGFDIDEALHYRRLHGILAAVAVVVLFPVGSILVRVVPGRLAVWVHAGFQMLAWGVYVAAAGLGIYLVMLVRIPGGGGLLQNPSTRYHPIIGLVLLALLVVQPVVGFIHHRAYKKVQKRQMWSYLHLAIGRGGITLGIVNGGLGLYLSNASAYYTRVYSIVAAVMWALWMAVAIWAEIKRARKTSKAKYNPVTKTPAGHERSS